MTRERERGRKKIPQSINLSRIHFYSHINKILLHVFSQLINLLLRLTTMCVCVYVVFFYIFKQHTGVSLFFFFYMLCELHSAIDESIIVIHVTTPTFALSSHRMRSRNEKNVSTHSRVEKKSNSKKKQQYFCCYLLLLLLMSTGKSSNNITTRTRV